MSLNLDSILQFYISAPWRPPTALTSELETNFERKCVNIAANLSFNLNLGSSEGRLRVPPL